LIISLSQIAFLPWFNLSLFLVLYWTIFAQNIKLKQVIILSWCAGLLFDLLSSNFFGFNIIIFTGLSSLTYFLSRFIIKNHLAYLILIIIASLSASLLCILI